MKTFIHILIGFVIGVICTLGVLTIFAVGKVTQEQIEVPESYFDVKTKNGKIHIHTGMPKDSVLMLAGEPDRFSTSTVRGHIVEEARYVVNNKRIPDLTFSFIDGILTDCSQR